MKTVQRLKDLLGRATPGPVELIDEPHVCVIRVGEAYMPAPYQPPNGRGRCQRQRDDGALFVKSRNALPALLAVVEAAEQVVRDMDSWDAAVSKVIDCSKVPKWESKETLRKALAALNTETKTNG